MNLNIQVLLTSLVFASQIVVLSFYAPLRWRRYYASLFTRFPPEQYPRLYPLPRNDIERKLAIFRSLHLVIGVGAALTLSACLIVGASPRGFVSCMSVSSLVQVFLPLYIAMPLSARISQAFRAMPPPSVRSVELRHWQMTDFVSPSWIALGIAGQVLALGCAAVLYLYRPDTLGILPVGIGSAAVLSRMLYLLSGHAAFARPDPYMSQADTFRVRRRPYRLLFCMGAGFGALFAFVLLYNARLIRFDFSYIMMAFSVGMQVLAVALASLQDSDLDRRDFSVYRADSGAQATS
jgi:hypothetical protein